MDVSFLFLDESDSQETKVASITALVIPIKRYPDLRSKFYKIVPRVKELLADGNTFIHLDPPEVHASQLFKHLPWDDKVRIETMDRFVDLIISEKLEIYRSGINITPEVIHLSQKMQVDQRFFDLCWANMVFKLDPKLAVEMIIPIMDGLNLSRVREMSPFIQMMDQMREAGWEDKMSIKNSRNILGEVFYSESKYSIFTQLVDAISYLRHISDWSKRGLEMSQYKQELLTISERLSPIIVCEEIQTLQFEIQESEQLRKVIFK